MTDDVAAAVFRCPHCRAVLHVTGGAMSDEGFTARTFQAYHLGGGAAETWQELSRTKPHGKATRESDVVVPLAQSAITGAVLAVPVGVLAASQGWSAYVPLSVMAGTFALSWLYLLRDSRGLLRITERIVNRDLDGDGRIGDTPAEPKSSKPNVRVDITERHDGGMRLRFLDVPIAEHKIITLARGVMNGRAFSEREWAGRGRPLSVSEFRELREQLFRANYMRWQDGGRRQGVEFTAKGRALFRRLAELDPTPPPDDDVTA